MKYLWTTIHVKNLQESIDFYTEILGLKVTQRFPAGPGTEIAFVGNDSEGETLIELLCNEAENNISFSNCITLGFAVASVAHMQKMISEKNIPVLSDIIESPKLKWFTVSDPNGVCIQFFENKA